VIGAGSSSLRLALGLIVVAAIAPQAQAHAGAAIAVEAREEPHCVETQVCVELVSIPPDLEPGHETALALRVHPNASQAYEAGIAHVSAADAEDRRTPRSAAIALTPAAASGQTTRVNLTVPETGELYVWLPGDDHEARGGWETLPLAVQPENAGNDSQTVAGPGPAGALAAVLALATVLRRDR
jgi:hypothetical protein